MKPFFILTALTYIALSINTSAAKPSKQQMVDDITVLSSDEMQGRKVFTKNIEKAAEFISGRFSKIGLLPMKGDTTFKQNFTVKSVKPESLEVVINGVKISDTKLAMASTIRLIDWKKPSDFKTTIIGEKDDIRGVLSSLNLEGGKHLVLLNTAHAEMFSRYQQYFQGGLTKLNLDHQGAIVIVLTDDFSIKDIHVKATTSIVEKRLTNVVGIIPGKTKPKEIVLFSAHYDHLGVKPGKTDEDTLFNGADDDASGTTAIINLAEHYKNQNDNARTLMFVAFTAEEIGGFGSRYFSEQLNADDVVAMINIEMIGKPAKFGVGTVWMTGMERSNLGDLLNKNLKTKGFEIHQDPYPEQHLFYRSDNATLARLGVPAHSFSSTQLDKDQYYHKATDELSTLNMDSMYQVIESLSIATQGLVNGSITPTRIDKTKVRAKGKIY